MELLGRLLSRNLEFNQNGNLLIVDENRDYLHYFDANGTFIKVNYGSQDTGFPFQDGVFFHDQDLETLMVNRSNIFLKSLTVQELVLLLKVILL